MSLITTLPDRLCEWLSSMSELADCSFCTQFPVNSKATPLERPVVVFGTDSFTVLDNTTDETGAVITDSRIAQLKFSMGLHVPRGYGGNGCNRLLDRLSELILFDTSLSVSGISTDSIEYLRNTDSLYIRCIFEITEKLVRRENYPEALNI